MAHPKRVAKVQQALKREISTMFVSDKASRPYLIPQHPPASQGTEALGEAVHTGRIPCPHRPFRTSQRRHVPHLPPPPPARRQTLTCDASTTTGGSQGAVPPRDQRRGLRTVAAGQRDRPRGARTNPRREGSLGVGAPACVKRETEGPLRAAAAAAAAAGGWGATRQLSNDLQVAKVYVSVLADQAKKEETILALSKLSGYAYACLVGRQLHSHRCAQQRAGGKPHARNHTHRGPHALGVASCHAAACAKLGETKDRQPDSRRAGGCAARGQVRPQADRQEGEVALDARGPLPAGRLVHPRHQGES